MKEKIRIRVSPNGQLEIIDPSTDALALLLSIQPEFKVRTAPLARFRTPRIHACSSFGVGGSAGDLARMSVPALWQLHSTSVRTVRQRGFAPGAAGNGGVSLLTLKMELARRTLEDCVLCARRCHVNRLAGGTGVCLLGADAAVAAHFIHIAEEAPINPAYIFNLDGCSLRCRFCQQGSLLDPSKTGSRRLDSSLWSDVVLAEARSISFAGGNPDESLPAILNFLAAMPGDCNLPIVWNTHGYCSHETLSLLDGVVDVYLPDFKYGNDGCAFKLSGCGNYVKSVRAAIRQMMRQGTDVLVRILVLPGHVNCCHRPTIDWISEHATKDVVISIRDQYSPDWHITAQDGVLSRRVLGREVEEVRKYCREKGLRLV